MWRIKDLSKKIAPVLNGQSACINSMDSQVYKYLISNKMVILQPTKELCIQTYKILKQANDKLKINRLGSLGLVSPIVELISDKEFLKRKNHEIIRNDQMFNAQLKSLNFNDFDVIIARSSYASMFEASDIKDFVLVIDEGDLHFTDPVMSSEVFRIQKLKHKQQVILCSVDSINTPLKSYTSREFMQLHECDHLDKPLPQLDLTKSIVFFNSAEDCRKWAKELKGIEYHSQLSAEDRIRNLILFQTSQRPLMATNLASRGLQLDARQVIVYDLPETKGQLLLQLGRAENRFVNLKNSTESARYNEFLLMDYNYDQYTQKAYSANVYKVDESEFIIDKRYKPTQQLGSGAYGIVIGCEDQKSESDNKNVAIKKIERTFEHRFYAKRTLRELKILRNLKHENIVNLMTIQLPKSRKNFYDIYIVTELLDTDLKRVLDKEHTKLNQDHFKLFLYQILRAMKYMHSANILHRDLKPTNLLLNKKDCMLKVCDFGLSRALLQTTKGQSQNPNIMTDYVETRYYRAPELLLGLKTYTHAVDMWSVGCIFAEIVRGKTLWKGQNSKQQLKLIFETLGTPSKTKMLQISDTFVSQKMIDFVQECGQLEKIPWDKVVKGLTTEGYDLLEKLLELDYKKRITAAEALKHPYLKDLHNPDDEPTRSPVSNMEFEFETYEFTNEQLKGNNDCELDLIYEEILLYHFPEFKKAQEEKIKNNQSIIQHIVKGSNAKIIDPEADDDFPV